MELELHIGVLFCLLRELAFYQPVFNSSLKVLGEHIFCIVLAVVTSIRIGMRGRDFVLCCIMYYVVEERAEEQQGGAGEKSALTQRVPAARLTLVQVGDPAGLCPAV